MVNGKGLDVARLVIGRVVLHFEGPGARPTPMVVVAAGDDRRVNLRSIGAAGPMEVTGCRPLDDAGAAPEEYFQGFWKLTALDEALVGFLFSEDGSKWADLPSRAELGQMLFNPRRN